MLKESKGKVSSKIQQGFTIIEVIIVLVIAAIIMLAVFLVVPQLNRSQRNSRNQDNARRALTAATQFSANNNGAAPTTSLNITDITGAMKIGGSTTDAAVAVIAGAAAESTTVNKVGNISVYTNAKCSGSLQGILSTGGTAVVVGLEPGSGAVPQANTSVGFCVEV